MLVKKKIIKNSSKVNHKPVFQKKWIGTVVKCEMYVHVAHSLWEFIGRMEEEPTQHLQRGVMIQKSVEYPDDLSKCVDKGSLSLKCPKEFKFS